MNIINIQQTVVSSRAGGKRAEQRERGREREAYTQPTTALVGRDGVVFSHSQNNNTKSANSEPQNVLGVLLYSTVQKIVPVTQR
jgi:hypothetical protein